MEDDFKVRVDKIFGALSSSSTSPSVSSLWSLTDDEIERREWNRDKEIIEPEQNRSEIFAKNRKGIHENNCGELDNELEDLDDDDNDNDISFKDEDEPESSNSKPDDLDDEEWEIKRSIGLDCTLDKEEEEDGYDKVAIGKEDDGDRVYMKDITDDGINIDSCYEFPDSFKDVTRDPRANRIAAIMRLKEDAEAATKVASMQGCPENVPSAVDGQINTLEDGNLKSILKRKDNQLDLKLQKRVRFDPQFVNSCKEESEGAKDIQMESCASEEAAISNEASISPRNFSSGVPDYIRNPSRYTHYTFDSSSDADEESNKQAYADFLKLLKGSNTMESESDNASMDLPKSVTFVPRRKTSDATMVENCTELKPSKDDLQKETNRRVVPICIAASETNDGEVCAMEEDGLEIVANRKNGSQRPNRQYRTKGRLEMEDCVT